MKRIAGTVLSVPYYLIFFLLLVVFHPVQVISRHLGGYHAHKRSVEILNYLLLQNLRVLGSSISFHGFDRIPEGRPLIIVSNHQSSMDIPPVVWGFRKWHPKFISKKELGRFIPSISYNLRHGGSILIDRSNRQQAVKEIAQLGERLEKNRHSACIFPEGTRSRDGQVRSFKIAGIAALLKHAPSALVVPFAVDGNYRLYMKGSKLFNAGQRLRYTALEPLEPAGRSVEEVVNYCEDAIRRALGQV
jgi:1-acyl-sn-glycerol-3-phosphate acyltransferase